MYEISTESDTCKKDHPLINSVLSYEMDEILHSSHWAGDLLGGVKLHDQSGVSAIVVKLLQRVSSV